MFVLLSASAANGQTSDVSGKSSDLIYSETWDCIQPLGRMVVSVNANTPPFALFDKSVASDGFDISVMRENGQQIDARLYVVIIVPSS